MSSSVEPSSTSIEVELTLQAQRAEYATVALAVAWFWDLLITTPEELSLMSGAFLTIPNLAYTIARLVTCSFLVVTVIFTVTPAGSVNCHTLLTADAWLLAMSTPCNALLFLIRIRGIFSHSRKIVWTFVVLWATTFASILTPLNFVGGQFVLANRICLVEETKVWASIGFFTILIFDTAVFVAISARVLSINMAASWGERARIFIGRKHLGRLSKVLLHSGQQFYLVTIGVHLLIIITLLLPHIPAPYRGTLAVVTGTFHNIMACRVFKLLKFGFTHEIPQTHSQLPEFMSLDSSFARTNLERV